MVEMKWGHIAQPCTEMMRPMTQSVTDRLREEGAEAFRDSPVLFAYLFGSVAAGRARPGSDVDVAVFLEPRVPAHRFLDLSLDLAGRLSASGVGAIEVTVLNEAPLALRGRAVRERIVLYSRDEPARVRFESATLREFFDFQIHAVPLDRKFLGDTVEGRR